MLDLDVHETKLLKIKQDLESWHSLIPQCVTMGYDAIGFSFRNNGEPVPMLQVKGRELLVHS